MKKITCVDRYDNQHEVPVAELEFRPAVYAVMIKDNAILLSKQWDGYDFPGGKIELGEGMEAALSREVKEETGLEVRIGKIVTCEDSFFRTMKGDYLHSIMIYYLCDSVGGELSIAHAGENEKSYIAMPEWIPLEKIDKIKFYNSIDSLSIIRQAQEIA